MYIYIYIYILSIIITNTYKQLLNYVEHVFEQNKWCRVANNHWLRCLPDQSQLMYGFYDHCNSLRFKSHNTSMNLQLPV